MTQLIIFTTPVGIQFTDFFLFWSNRAIKCLINFERFALHGAFEQKSPQGFLKVNPACFFVF